MTAMVWWSLVLCVSLCTAGAQSLAPNHQPPLRTSATDPSAALGLRTAGVGSALSRSPAAAAPGAAVRTAGGGAARQRAEVFQDCAVCPEMVVLPGGGLALGRYEVTVGEYRAFASATGGGPVGGCTGTRGDFSWKDLGYPQTDRHPVACVSWEDAQAYVSWLSQRAGATYRLPSEAEWEQAAVGSQPGCHTRAYGAPNETCPVGSYGSNTLGLYDMVGNVFEFTADCWEVDCRHRVLRGGSWFNDVDDLRPDLRGRLTSS